MTTKPSSSRRSSPDRHRRWSDARSSFYAWLAAAKARAARKAADQDLAHEITVIQVASRHTYGVPRIHAELRRLARAVNRKHVARLIREHCTRVSPVASAVR
ncbi:IS3 family transposase [Streptomyces sp. JV185]|nr:IS3 family transposase [Streptomyces sp. JV185]MEE1768318.1 IS3 family transposase [Streptomyces sp. JV185]